MTDLRSTADKLAAFRTRYPDRAEKLRHRVSRLLGCPLNSKLSPEAIAQMCAPTEDLLLSIIYGLEPDTP